MGRPAMAAPPVEHVDVSEVRSYVTWAGSPDITAYVRLCTEPLKIMKARSSFGHEAATIPLQSVDRVVALPGRSPVRGK
jgi:hypothetical protein